jgi:hypothetical protein
MKTLLMVSFFLFLFCFETAQADEIEVYVDSYIHQEFPGSPWIITGQPSMKTNQTKPMFVSWEVKTSYFIGDKVTITPPVGWVFSQCAVASYGPDPDLKTPTIDANMEYTPDGSGKIVGGSYVYTFTVNLPWNDSGDTGPWVTATPYEVCINVKAPPSEDVGNISFSDTQGNWGNAEIMALAPLILKQPPQQIPLKIPLNLKPTSFKKLDYDFVKYR